MTYSDFVMQWHRIGRVARQLLECDCTIDCKVCGRRFPAWDVDTTQANDCAAAVYDKHDERRLVGFYGSTVADMRIYRFVREPLPPCDPICDYCITDLIREGRIEYVGEDRP